MTGVEEETVATYPSGILGVVLQILAIEHVNEVGTTHGTSGVTTLCFFNS